MATDGVVRRQGPGEVLLLDPGESVTLMPGNWHEFWGEGGDVLIGEVSTVNNDLTDNVFNRADRALRRDRGGRGPAAPAGVGLPALVRVNRGNLRTLLEF